MFFKTSNPSALAAWQKYQQDCQKVKDEAKRLEAVLNVACRSVFVSGISGFCFKGLRFTEDKYPFHRDLWRKPTASNGADLQREHPCGLQCRALHADDEQHGHASVLAVCGGHGQPYPPVAFRP